MLKEITTFTTYTTQSPDTTIAAELAQFSIWRSWSPTQRATHLNHNTRSARSTAWHLAQITRTTPTQQIHYFLRKVLDRDWCECLQIQGEMKMTGAIEEALIVAEILESLEIPYLIGGSVASGIWGEMRYTQDIDIVANLQESQIQHLLNAFSPRFYISEMAIREAILWGHSFNLIDNETAWKIDVFILTQDPFKQSKFQRRQQVSVDETGRTLNFSSPEDTILQKLLWYRMTQKGSDRQWRDILGILKLQKTLLDRAYLQQWADILQLVNELEQAFTESGD
jgi:hypothetical protein